MIIQSIQETQKKNEQQENLTIKKIQQRTIG